MEEFKKSLHEIYMNYDTVQFLKEDNQSINEIIEMFNEELEYSKELTSNLLKYDKTFLKSIAMRIKLKMKKNVESEEIKKEILSYDKTLQPLLEKLLITNKFKQQYNNVINSNESNLKLVENNSKIDEVSEVSEANEESEDEDLNNEVDEDNSNSVELFISSDVEKTEDGSDFIKVSELYKHYCSYCEGENLDEISKSDFKKYLASKWGKSVKSGYTGYRMLEE